MHVAFVVAALVAFVALPGADSLQCYVQNSIPNVFTQTCPPNINQCMKFVCRMNGAQQISKGCNDPANPPISCNTLQANCQAQGGTGQCYQCNYEYCNTATLHISSFTALLPVFAYFFFFLKN